MTLRPCDDRFAWLLDEVADSLAGPAETSEGTEQRHLLAGIDAIAVYLASGADHLMAALPNSKSRGG